MVKTVTVCQNFIFFMKSLKSKKKKLALTSLYYLDRKMLLSNSWKFIHLDQSRFYNSSHPGEVKYIQRILAF